MRARRGSLAGRARAAGFRLVHAASA
jgi:hypothetical protein